jgi:hypothetical protein
MVTLAKTKTDASRALAQADITYLGELEVVNESDLRALTGFIAAQLRKDKKLRLFVAARVTKHR